jgi:hypothetical protein
MTFLLALCASWMALHAEFQTTALVNQAYLGRVDVRNVG